MAKNSADDPSGSDSSSSGGGSLHAPWRMEYIRSLQKPDASAASAAGDCFICQAAQAASAAERAQRLVLWTTEQSVVLINRFPYTNGHLLIAPRGIQLDAVVVVEQVDRVILGRAGSGCEADEDGIVARGHSGGRRIMSPGSRIRFVKDGDIRPRRISVRMNDRHRRQQREFLRVYHGV